MSYIFEIGGLLREKSYCTGRLILLERSYQKLLKGNKKVMDTKKPPILVSYWGYFCPGGKRVITQKKYIVGKRTNLVWRSMPKIFKR